MRNGKATEKLNNKTGLPKLEARFFIEGFLMTLKKSKKDLARAIRGQSIFEYLLLTAAVVAVVLFFVNSDFFKNIKSSCETAFNNAVEEMVK